MAKESKKYLWEKKTDKTLQFWPEASTEHHLSKPTVPQNLTANKMGAQISAPEALPFDILEERGILNAALSEHDAHFYQSRSAENFSMIALTLGGCGEVKTSDGKFTLRKGSLFLAPTGSSYTLETSAKWKILWFHLSDSAFWGTMLPHEILVGKSSKLEQIVFIAKEYLSEVYKPERDLPFLSSLADILLHYLKSEFSSDASPENKLEKIFEDFLANPSKVPSAKAVAKTLRLSIYDLDKAAQKLRGMNFAKVISEMRMAAICKLLRTNASISECAKRTGFCDAYALSKAFKRRFGISPSEYR